jgi:opacity protein-like surface antigen
MTSNPRRTIACGQCGTAITRAAFVFFAAGLWAANANAQEAMLRANNQVWLDAGAQQLHYWETIGPGKSDSERGTTAAFSLGASTQRQLFGVSNLYFSGSVRVAHGNVDYGGYLADSSGRVVQPNYQMNTRSTATDVTLKAGKAFPFHLGTWNAQMIPYVSYSYHDWIRDSSSDPYGFYERYRHHVIGGGLMGQLEVTPKLVATADIRAGAMVGASLTLAGSQNTFTLGNKPVVVAGFGLDYAIARNFHVNATYEWSRFQYGRSGVTQVTPGVNAYEPDSKTINQTWMIGAGYAF